MVSIARASGGTGAENDMAGDVAINATWAEDIYFTDATGAPQNIANLDFKMTFRRAVDATPDYTLSTDDGTLSIEDDDDGYHRILRITVPPGTFTQVGDYIADLASSDDDDVVTPWAHGIVSFYQNPVTWG